MAKAAVRLNEDENVIFHSNYSYMWKKLNTVPYYVSGAGEVPPWVKEPWLLPSYANLSKCQSLEYVPSINLVNKIVQFYNANIHPEVDTYTFLHERLESSDNIRTSSTVADVTPFCGIYQGYYYSAITNKKEVYGALLRIEKSYDEIAVHMITGLTDDADIQSMALKKLFSEKNITLEKYKEYRDSLPLAKRRTALYKGHAKIESSFISIELQSVDREGSIVILSLPLTEPIDNRYFGSIGMLSLFSGRNLQILKMGVVRNDEPSLKTFSIDSEEVENILNLEKLSNEHIQINFQDNDLWHDMILSNIE